MPPFKSSLIELIDNLFFAEKNVSADKAYIRMKRMTSPTKNSVPEKLRILNFVTDSSKMK